MAYFAAYIDETGLHVPVYADINQYLLDQYTAIFGQSVSTNISSSDVQSISIFALMISDSYLAAQAVFNGMSPSKAIGAQQDSLYKLNGIARNPATFSTATVTVTGIPNLELINRTAQDTNGNIWDLPTDFVIPSGGTINVTAICETPGAVTAAIGAINIINNPITGWTGVNNSAAAFPGTPVEPDSAFRARQALSVALPSQTLFQGTLADVAGVYGVTRYGGVENPTGVTDSYGTPPHSISVVVEGGGNTDIAQAIYLNKTPGCLTNGTAPAGSGVTVSVSDPITGQTMPISFYRPTYELIQVNITVKALGGYTTATTAAIQSAVVSYLTSLQIGELVSVGAVTATVMNVNPTLTNPIFTLPSLTLGISGGSIGTTDIAIAFNQVANCDNAHVAITVI